MKFFKCSFIVAVAVVVGSAIYFYAAPQSVPPAPIKVGVLYSLTGTMAISTKPVINATLLAIDEINREGGLLGRPLQAVVADGKSDPAVLAREAERLFAEEHVSVIFGCWTSVCRKAVKPVVARYGNLLVYPVQYEGLEASEHILYMGAAPNQQIIPALLWLFEHVGKRLYLVGSDYVFPRIANLIIRDIAKANGAEVLAERYRPLGDGDFRAIAAEIAALKPDVILNTVNGDSNIALFKQLRNFGFDANDTPVLSFSVSEAEIAQIGIEFIQGHYAAWNYFECLDTPENRAFVARYRQRYGADAAIGDPMNSAYLGVKLWAETVKKAATDAPAQVKISLRQASIAGQTGIVSVDSENLHVYKTAYVGRVNARGGFDIVWSSEIPIKPSPFPVYRTRMAWEEIIAPYEVWEGP